MTKYEKLIEGAANLRMAAMRANDKRLAAVLRIKAAQLVTKARGLTIEEASRDAR